MTVQIFFQIEGNATPETVAQMQQYGDVFASNVIRVVKRHFWNEARMRI